MKKKQKKLKDISWEEGRMWTLLSPLPDMRLITPPDLMKPLEEALVERLEKARRTNFFLFIIGVIIGCGLTLFGIGIGLATGML